VKYFVSKASRRIGKQIKSVPDRVMQLLTRNDWRGNIRELANFIERAVILTRGDELEVSIAELAPSPETCVTTRSKFHQAESSVIIEALKEASGRLAGRGGAAERLGLKRTTLLAKMQKLNICRADYAC
jgi:formate hydrogenlyase transcriptional activator